jgi:heme exporter protein B
LAAFSLITHGQSKDLLTNPLTRAIASNHSWIIWVLAPLTSVLGVGFLFFLSALVVGSGALAVYRIGQLWQLEPRTSAVISSLYLLYPPLIAANIYDFHPGVWAVPLLLWMVWFAFKKNWWGFGIIMVLMTGLGMPVTGALVLTGIGLLLNRKSVWFGAADLMFAALYWSLGHGGLVLPDWAWTGQLSLRTALYLIWVLLPPMVAAATSFRRPSTLNHWWLLVGVVFGFALDPTVVNLRPVFTGVLWTAWLFALLPPLERSYAEEWRNGALDGYRAAGGAPADLFYAKALVALLAFAVGGVVLGPVFGAMLQVRTGAAVGGFAASFALGALGVVPAASLAAAVAARAFGPGAGAALLPLLSLPLLSPGILAAVRAAGGFLDGSGWAAAMPWFSLLLAYALLFWALPYVLFPIVAEGAS